MKRERDTQREKVYRAERELHAAGVKGRTFQRTEEIIEYSNRLLQTEWFERNFNAKRRPMNRFTGARVHDGGGRVRACCWGQSFDGKIRMSFPKWSRFELMVLHEIAHVLIPYAKAAHGREFCEVYLSLVRNRMGVEAERALKTAFRKQGVKYRPKRQLAPEQIEALRERGRALAKLRLASGPRKPSAKKPQAEEKKRTPYEQFVDLVFERRGKRVAQTTLSRTSAVELWSCRQKDVLVVKFGDGGMIIYRTLSSFPGIDPQQELRLLQQYLDPTPLDPELTAK